MKISILNVCINIVLDAVFTKYLNYGMKGIAVSSLIASIVMVLQCIYFFLKKSKVYHFGFFRLEKEVIKETVLNGISEFIGEMSMCISMMAYNFVILRRVGIDGVAAFTIVGYVTYFFSMIILGFGQGLVPLVSFVYGAREQSLAHRLRRLTQGFVVGAASLLIIILLFAGNAYSTTFTDDAGIQKMIRSGILIYMISYPLAGINTIISFYFTSIGKAKESAVISSLRGLIILLICIFTLPYIFGMNGVWLVNPITELITVGVSVYFIAANRKFELINNVA